MNRYAQNKFHHTIFFCLIFSFMVFIFCLPSKVFAQDSLVVSIFNVDATPVENKVEYSVKIHLSVLDSAGYPIDDLTTDNFSVKEEAESVELNSASIASDELTHIVIALDTSGSMDGRPIRAARTASDTFLNRLGPNDQVAMIRFDERAEKILDFTDNRKAARDQLDGLNVATSGGTCLYDAVYQSVSLALTKPAGQRAILLLTDGMDKIPGGGVCSSHTIEDVIRLLSEENSRVPVYVIGMGTEIDEPSLKRLSDISGGQYIYTTDPATLEEMFNKISLQIKAKYSLEYTSTNTPGGHNITISTDFKGAKGEATSRFVLPEFPTTISILQPQADEQVYGKIKIVTKVLTQNETIARVVCTTDGESCGEDFNYPFEFEWNSGEPSSDGKMIEVIAIGTSGNELARDQINVVVIEEPIQIPAATEPVALVETEQDLLPTQELDETTSTSINKSIFIVIPLLILIVMGVLIWYFIIRPRRKSEETEIEDHFQVDVPNEKVKQTGEIIIKENDNPDGEVLATMKLKQSKDAFAVGEIFNMTKSRINIGRSPDSDWVLPQVDSAVSRNHAIIEKIGERFVLSEGRNPNGERPKYGTFVNDQKIGEDIQEPVHLKSGDMIQLGKGQLEKQVLVCFECSKQSQQEVKATGEFEIPPQTKKDTIETRKPEE